MTHINFKTVKKSTTNYWPAFDGEDYFTKTEEETAVYTTVWAEGHTSLKEIYNDYIRALLKTGLAHDIESQIGEYDDLLGNATLAQLGLEYQENGSPADIYDYDWSYEDSIMKKVFEMDTVCRTPILAALFQREYKLVWSSVI